MDHLHIATDIHLHSSNTFIVVVVDVDCVVVRIVDLYDGLFVGLNRGLTVVQVVDGYDGLFVVFNGGLTVGLVVRIVDWYGGLFVGLNEGFTVFLVVQVIDGYDGLFVGLKGGLTVVLGPRWHCSSTVTPFLEIPFTKYGSAKLTFSP